MRVRVPGDKSITQRALIVAALASGESRLAGLLHGGDAESTAGALRALGVAIPRLPDDGSEITVRGVGLRGLKDPAGPLDLGNSGTGARLLLGVLSGAGVEATVTGDDSLRTRPMRRVTEPLEAMGAVFEALGEPGRLPLRVRPARALGSIDWTSSVASAQAKSALLLAGLTAGAFVLVTQPRRSRDHTERMLRRVGASVIEHAGEGGWRVELRDPPPQITPLAMTVPGDVSSAAFLLALGALGATRDSEVVVEGVGLNPTRTAFLEVLRRMGATVEVRPLGESAGAAGEPVGEVAVGAGSLRAVTIEPEEVPHLIDELPLVAAMGARAEGTTRISGAGELRAKESDRIAAMATNLRALGVDAEELDDGLVIKGTDAPLEGRVRAFGDHRIAMSMGVLGALPSSRIEIDEPETAAVSFPGFWSILDRLSAHGAPT